MLNHFLYQSICLFDSFSHHSRFTRQTFLMVLLLIMTHPLVLESVSSTIYTWLRNTLSVFYNPSDSCFNIPIYSYTIRSVTRKSRLSMVISTNSVYYHITHIISMDTGQFSVDLWKKLKRMEVPWVGVKNVVKEYITKLREGVRSLGCSRVYKSRTGDTFTSSNGGRKQKLTHPSVLFW